MNNKATIVPSKMKLRDRQVSRRNKAWVWRPPGKCPSLFQILLGPAWRHFRRDTEGKPGWRKPYLPDQMRKWDLRPGNPALWLLPQLWASCLDPQLLPLALCITGPAVLTHLVRLLERLINLMGAFEGSIHSKNSSGSPHVVVEKNYKVHRVAGNWEVKGCLRCGRETLKEGQDEKESSTEGKWKNNVGFVPSGTNDTIQCLLRQSCSHAGRSGDPHEGTPGWAQGCSVQVKARAGDLHGDGDSDSDYASDSASPTGPTSAAALGKGTAGSQVRQQILHLNTSWPVSCIKTCFFKARLALQNSGKFWGALCFHADTKPTCSQGSSACSQPVPRHSICSAVTRREALT